MRAVSIGNDTREVILDGIDISALTVSLPTMPRSKPEWGEIPSFPQLSIVVTSDKNQFHASHGASILFGKDLYNLPLLVKQFGKTLWKGNLINSPANLTSYRTTLNAASILQQKLNAAARLDADPLTPAKAIQNILIIHGIETDSASFNKADTLLDDIPVRVRVNPDVLEWQGTLADLLTPLLAAGVGRLFMLDSGKIGMDTYRQPSNVTESLIITDDMIHQHATITDEGFNPLQGYSVVFRFGTTFSSDLTQDIKSLDFSGEQPVTMIDQASADYCGSKWVELSKRRYIRLEMPIDKGVGQLLRLGYFARLQSELYGINKLGEVISIDDGDNRWTKIVLRIDKELS